MQIRKPEDLVDYINSTHNGCWTWIEGSDPPEIEDWADVIKEALRRGLITNYFAGGWDVREGLEVRRPSDTFTGVLRLIVDRLKTQKRVPGYPSAATRK